MTARYGTSPQRLLWILPPFAMPANIVADEEQLHSFGVERQRLAT